ncbi:MAG TPA: hypothetical protein VND64_20270, partial [Pirellulales bacterium]|nr:hypothetical protein [Pirellulales bacterium]
FVGTCPACEGFFIAPKVVLQRPAATLKQVSTRPMSFAKLETLPDHLPYRRALLSTFRYAVVFEVVADEIVLVPIAHTTRPSQPFP